MPNKFGEPIKDSSSEKAAIIAAKYFDQFGEVLDGVKIMSQSLAGSTIMYPHIASIKLVNEYYDAPKNAFVFDKQLVLDLLNKTDEDGKSSDFLMVHFAAKYENGVDQNGNSFNVGDPTIVLLACVSDLDGNDGAGIGEATAQNYTSNIYKFKTLLFDGSLVESPGGTVYPPPTNDTSAVHSVDKNNNILSIGLKFDK